MEGESSVRDRFWGAVLVIAGLAAAVGVAFIPWPWSWFAGFGLPGVFVAAALGGLGSFAPSPAMGLVFAAGRHLDPVAVGVAGGLGFAFGELPLYVLSRQSTRVSLPKWMAPERIIRAVLRLERHWYWWPVVLVIATVPSPLFDFIGIAGGRARISPWKVFLPIAAGRILRSIYLAYLGRWTD
jgi:membrane protein YqaA with SNARE-associated domain